METLDPSSTAPLAQRLFDDLAARMEAVPSIPSGPEEYRSVDFKAGTVPCSVSVNLKNGLPQRVQIFFKYPLPQVSTSETESVALFFVQLKKVGEDVQITLAPEDEDLPTISPTEAQLQAVIDQFFAPVFLAMTEVAPERCDLTLVSERVRQAIQAVYLNAQHAARPGRWIRALMQWNDRPAMDPPWVKQAKADRVLFLPSPFDLDAASFESIDVARLISDLSAILAAPGGPLKTALGVGWDVIGGEIVPSTSDDPSAGPAGLRLHLVELASDLYPDTPLPTGCHVVAGGAEATHDFPKVHAFTTAGGRDWNEDGYMVAPQACVVAVADGVGGYADGERASEIALALFARNNGQDPSIPFETTFRLIRVVLRQQALERSIDKNAGTTFACLRERPSDPEDSTVLVDVATVGDSVVLLLDPNEQKILYASTLQSNSGLTLADDAKVDALYSTLEASIRQRLSRAHHLPKRLSPDLKKEVVRLQHPEANIITNALYSTGPRPENLEDDLRTIPCPRGAIALLLTDGAFEVVSLFEIQELFYDLSFDEACKALESLVRKRQSDMRDGRFPMVTIGLRPSKKKIRVGLSHFDRDGKFFLPLDNAAVVGSIIGLD